jgi:hypothetical protein
MKTLKQNAGHAQPGRCAHPANGHRLGSAAAEEHNHESRAAGIAAQCRRFALAFLRSIVAPGPENQRECGGCSRPAYVAGHLTRCRITFANGRRMGAELCALCLDTWERHPIYVVRYSSVRWVERLERSPEEIVREAAMLAEQETVEARALAEGMGVTDDALVEIDGSFVRLGDLIVAQRTTNLVAERVS